VGDVIGWNFGGYTTADDHVSVVTGINQNGSINILDGNWGNAIGARTISPNASGISGHAIPTA
jgi:surface antigen